MRLCRFEIALSLCALLALVQGCATGGIGVVTDPPGASVRIIEPTTGTAAPLGVSPFEVPRPDPDIFVGDLVLVEIAKDGFVTEKFWLPNTARFNRLSMTSLNVKLSPVVKPLSPDLLRKAWDQAVQKIIETQRLVNNHQYLLAQAKVHEAIEIVGDFPQASRLLGSIYFLKGEFRKSKEIWRRFLVENPKDAEAAKMIKLIEGRLE